MLFKLRDNYYPYDETKINSEKNLEQTLRIIQEVTPGKAMRLISPAGDILDIALDEYTASIQFTNHTMLPPYLVPVNENAPCNEYHEFDVGGTPTPISLRHCIEPEKAIEIAVYFFHHGTIPNDVQWEEV